MLRAQTGRCWLAVAGGLAAVLVVVLAVAISQGVGDSRTGRAEVGFDRAAEFTLDDFDGQPFALADYASQPLFIYFWASWCGPCERAAPLIESLWPASRERGVTFLRTNLGVALRPPRTSPDPPALPSTTPMLGPLQATGGLTFHPALLPGSPAIDAGDDSAATATDQRGVSRPQRAASDIGAY